MVRKDLPEMMEQLDRLDLLVKPDPLEQLVKLELKE
jgi:hypothetical protein